MCNWIFLQWSDLDALYWMRTDYELPYADYRYQQVQAYKRPGNPACPKFYFDTDNIIAAWRITKRQPGDYKGYSAQVSLTPLKAPEKYAPANMVHMDKRNGGFPLGVNYYDYGPPVPEHLR